jgi:putative sigma-54 modulation protein
MKGKAKAKEFVSEGYNIHVTGRDVLVTEAMKDYAIEKLSKIDRLSPRIIDLHVTMDIQKLEHRVDVVIKVDHIKIVSSASSTDMYASIDKAAEKLEKQLRRYKTRIREHNAKPVNVIDLNVNVIKKPEEKELEDINIDIEDQNRVDLVEKYRPHEIVKQETVPLKMLTYHEAVMKMELSQDVFMIFRHEDDQKLKVIYRRNDENYGVIEVES